jgi:hypothetical protein
MACLCPVRGQGRAVREPLYSHPATARGGTSTPFPPTRGLVDVFLRERWRWKTEEEKSSSSPTLRVQGKKKTYGAVQNSTVFAFSFYFYFFLKKCMKRRRFS